MSPLTPRPAVLLGLVLTLVLAACSTSAPDGAAGTDDPDDVAAATLTGEYVLVSGEGPSGPIPVVDAAPVTLTIDGDRWTGTAACNTYRSTVEVDGERLEVGNVPRTEMGCVDQQVMRSEAAYLEAFVTVDRYRSDADRLVLHGPETELQFEPVVPEPDVPVVGTRWELVALVDGAELDGAVSSVIGAPELRLAEDGTFVAGTGCNDVTGRYELEGDTLTIVRAEMTDAGCSDDLQAAQEGHIIGTVGRPQDLSVAHDGRALRLMGRGGLGLDYDVAEDEA